MYTVLCLEVLLVAEGLNTTFTEMSTTEVLATGSDGWVLTTPLPWAVLGVKGVNLGNLVYMTGHSG